MGIYKYILASEDATAFLLDKNWIGEFIKWTFLTLVAVSIIVPIYIRLFYKGKNRVIEVIKRRKTVRDLFYPRFNASNHSSYIEQVNYTIDVKYDSGHRIHTLFCNEDIYNSLNVGGKYLVHIHIHEVTKIYNNKKMLW